MLNTLFPHQPTSVSDSKPRHHGRSKKILRPIVKHDGVCFTARFEGRPGICFGANEKEAFKNLRAGAQ